MIKKLPSLKNKKVCTTEAVHTEKRIAPIAATQFRYLMGITGKRACIFTGNKNTDP